MIILIELEFGKVGFSGGRQTGSGVPEENPLSKARLIYANPMLMLFNEPNFEVTLYLVCQSCHTLISILLAFCSLIDQSIK